MVGFVFWYRGLALSGRLLPEPVVATMIAFTALVVLCVAGAKRSLNVLM